MKNVLEGRWPVWAASAIAWALALAVVAIWPAVANDTVNRFAPMAEAFADGNWREAFHPRFGLLFQAMSGTLVRLTGLNGLTACAVVSTGVWAFAAVLLFGLAERCLGRRAAWVAVILYLTAMTPFYWALRGVREPLRLLGTLLMIVGVLDVGCRGVSRKALLAASFGLAVLCLSRCDTIVFAAVLGLAFAVRNRFRRETFALAAVGVAALQPMCMLVYAWTGWWVPMPHLVKFLVPCFGG